jgi:hypothetical protein
MLFKYGLHIHLIKTLENVQIRATKMLFCTHYPTKLALLNVSTLNYRRIRGDKKQNEDYRIFPHISREI